MKNKIKQILDAINKNNVVILKFANMHKMIEYFDNNNHLLRLSFIYDNFRYLIF